MKLSFRDKGLVRFDANAVASEAAEMSNKKSSSSLLRVAQLDISRNRIQVFLGGRTLVGLETLDASYNALRSAFHLPTSLVRLNLSHNELTSLTGLDTLTSLQFLDCCHNRVEDFGMLPCSLEVLKASHNRVTAVDQLCHLFRLLKLHLDHNDLSNTTGLALLGGLSALRHVTIAGNPVAEHPKIVALLSDYIPKLTTLDGAPLSQAQSNHSFRLLAKQRVDAERSAINESKRIKQSLRADPTDVVDIEIRSMTSKLSELERIAKEQYEIEAELRRKCQLLRQQKFQADRVVESQQLQIDRLRSEIVRDKDLCASLQRTCESLDRTYMQQHASLVSRRLSQKPF